MRDFFHSTKFKILLCVFALMFGFMIYAAVSAGAATIPEKILNTITSPFVSASTALSDWVTSTLDTLMNAQKYKSENEMLKEQLTELYSQIIDKEKIDEENTQLREMLGIAAENSDYKWLSPCSIVARNANDIFGGFTINKGTNDGVELYDPVFTSVGLVGRITEVSDSYSKVTTIISTDLQLSVATASEHVVGIIENDVEKSSQGYCVMSYITKDSRIKVGDVVVTAGSSAFPADMVVGTVEELYDDANGLSLHALIKPAEQFSTITSVFVITEFEGQAEEELR